MEKADIKMVIEAAEAGGKMIKKHFGKEGTALLKSTKADFQTKADIESETEILFLLEKYFPTYNILSEERGLIDKKSDYTFLVDPLDGTNNFVLGVPYVSVSIALMHKEKTLAAVVYNPFLSEAWWAISGQGSFLNGEKLSVNKENDISNSTISYIASYGTPMEDKREDMGVITNMSPKRLFVLWSPSLDFCLLASGKIEAIVDKSDEVYDFVPGRLIAEEAGAKVTSFKGEKISDMERYFLISNGTEIHEEIINFLKK